MAGPLIVACIGSSDPIIREYVHDFGLCAINLTMLEETLRHHLAHQAMLRAEWHGNGDRRGIKGKKYLKVMNKLSLLTLGGLVGEYERTGGNPALVLLLRPLVDDRNTMLHNYRMISENGEFKTARIQELRASLHDLSQRARDASHAVQLADVDVFNDLINRLKAEGAPTDSFGPPLQLLLEQHRQFLLKTGS